MTQPDPSSLSPAEYTHLGAYLKSLREHYELSVAQVSSRIHIQAKYIEALEEGNMAALPGKVYTKGYILSYAEFLGLDPATIIAQYEGLEATAPKPKFRIIEPTEQKGVPAWRYLVVVAAAMLLVYGMVHWLSSDSGPQRPQSSIEPVPDRLLEKARAPLVITERNKACLNLTPKDNWLPCYYLGEPEMKLRSLMELR